MASLGHVDHLSEKRVAGWAVASDGTPENVQISLNGEPFMMIAAKLPRPDLARAKLSQGLGGFNVSLAGALPAGSHTVEATVAGQLLANGRRQIVVEDGFREVDEIHAGRLAARNQSAKSIRIVGDVAFAVNLGSGSAFSKMMKYGGWRLAQADEEADATLVYDPLCNIVLPSAINGGGFDNDKAAVAKAHYIAFGRDVAVDPATFDGMMVVKSRRNAAHDGQIIQGPAPVDLATHTAQRFLNSEQSGFVQDIRVPIIGKLAPPLVYLKYRPAQTRFANNNTTAVLSSPYDVFTPDEIAALTRFARTVGLDYGEMDVVRDIPSGEIYVVDVNNTPSGPPNGLSADEGMAAMRILAASFETAFLKRS